MKRLLYQTNSVFRKIKLAPTFRSGTKTKPSPLTPLSLWERGRGSGAISYHDINVVANERFATLISFGISLLICSVSLFAQKNYSFQIALLKYNGGGDWYANIETSLPNLIKFCNKELKTNINPEQAIVEPSSKDIFKYPFVHITGHGNIIFSDAEAENLRKYLIAGGFLHISDNYGLDKYIRREMKKVFPELEFVELPFSHPIYHQKYNFPNGLPKNSRTR